MILKFIIVYKKCLKDQNKLNGIIYLVTNSEQFYLRCIKYWWPDLPVWKYMYIIGNMGKTRPNYPILDLQRLIQMFVRNLFQQIDPKFI